MSFQVITQELYLAKLVFNTGEFDVTKDINQLDWAELGIILYLSIIVKLHVNQTIIKMETELVFNRWC